MFEIILKLKVKKKKTHEGRVYQGEKTVKAKALKQRRGPETERLCGLAQ